jgi:hypothetical protein
VETAGIGSATHVSGLFFQRRSTGIEIAYVRYRRRCLE